MVAGEIVAVCISKEREQLKEEIPKVDLSRILA